MDTCQQISASEWVCEDSREEVLPVLQLNNGTGLLPNEQLQNFVNCNNGVTKCRCCCTCRVIDDAIRADGSLIGWEWDFAVYNYDYINNVIPTTVDANGNQVVQYDPKVWFVRYHSGYAQYPSGNNGIAATGWESICYEVMECKIPVSFPTIGPIQVGLPTPSDPDNFCQIVSGYNDTNPLGPPTQSSHITTFMDLTQGCILAGEPNVIAGTPQAGHDCQYQTVGKSTITVGFARQNYDDIGSETVVRDPENANSYLRFYKGDFNEFLSSNFSSLNTS